MEKDLQVFLIYFGYAGLGVICQMISNQLPAPPLIQLCSGLILCVITGLCTTIFED